MSLEFSSTKLWSNPIKEIQKSHSLIANVSFVSDALRQSSDDIVSKWIPKEIRSSTDYHASTVITPNLKPLFDEKEYALEVDSTHLDASSGAHIYCSLMKKFEYAEMISARKLHFKGKPLVLNENSSWSLQITHFVYVELKKIMCAEYLTYPIVQFWVKYALDGFSTPPPSNILQSK